MLTGNTEVIILQYIQILDPYIVGNMFNAEMILKSFHLSLIILGKLSRCFRASGSLVRISVFNDPCGRKH